MEVGKNIIKLYKLFRPFRGYLRRLLNENRWRASPYGWRASSSTLARVPEAETRRLVDELLSFVLGSQREMANIERIVREGMGADRQLAVFQQTNDMKAVVDQIVAGTYEGVTEPEAAATTELSRRRGVSSCARVCQSRDPLCHSERSGICLCNPECHGT